MTSWSIWSPGGPRRELQLEPEDDAEVNTQGAIPSQFMTAASPSMGWEHDRQPILVPPDPAITLWRYMDFTKFLALVSKRALHFSQPQLLSDPFEGSAPIQNLLARWAQGMMLDGPGGGARYTDFQAHANLNSLSALYVSCWHANEHESAAMWKLYLRDHGLAVRTTAGKLASALRIEEIADFNGLRCMVHLGHVTYIDYETQSFPEANAFHKCMHKRLSFQHENEVRAIFQHRPQLDADAPDGQSRVVQPTGIDLQIDLANLVDAVFVNPEAPDWIVGLTESICQRFDLSWPVRRSDLGRDPVY